MAGTSTAARQGSGAAERGPRSEDMRRTAARERAAQQDDNIIDLNDLRRNGRIHGEGTASQRIHTEDQQAAMDADLDERMREADAKKGAEREAPAEEAKEDEEEKKGLSTLEKVGIGAAAVGLVAVGTVAAGEHAYHKGVKSAANKVGSAVGNFIVNPCGQRPLPKFEPACSGGDEPEY